MQARGTILNEDRWVFEEVIKFLGSRNSCFYEVGIIISDLGLRPTPGRITQFSMLSIGRVMTKFLGELPPKNAGCNEAFDHQSDL